MRLAIITQLYWSHDGFPRFESKSQSLNLCEGRKEGQLPVSLPRRNWGSPSLPPSPPLLSFSHASRRDAKSRIDDTKNWQLGINLWTLNMIKIWICKCFIEPFKKPIFHYFHTLKKEFPFCITYLRKLQRINSFAIFLKQNWYFQFQGCHN